MTKQPLRRMRIPKAFKPVGAHSEVGVAWPEQQKPNPIERAWPLPPRDWLVLSVVGRGKEDMGRSSGGVAKKERQSPSAQALVRDREGA